MGLFQREAVIVKHSDSGIYNPLNSWKPVNNFLKGEDNADFKLCGDFDADLRGSAFPTCKTSCWKGILVRQQVLPFPRLAHITVVLSSSRTCSMPDCKIHVPLWTTDFCYFHFKETQTRPIRCRWSWRNCSWVTVHILVERPFGATALNLERLETRRRCLKDVLKMSYWYSFNPFQGLRKPRLAQHWHTGIVEARCRHAMTTFNGCWRTTTRKMGQRLQNHVWRSW